jgi:hypothetical protein
MLRRVVKAIDHELLREWLDAYASVEAELELEEEDEDEDGFVAVEPRPAPRRPRPSYLRALDGLADSEDDEEPASVQTGGEGVAETVITDEGP